MSGTPSALHAFASSLGDSGALARSALQPFLDAPAGEPQVEIMLACQAVNAALQAALEGLRQDALLDQATRLATLLPINDSTSARVLCKSAHTVAVGLVFSARSFKHSPTRPIGFVDRAAEAVGEAFGALDAHDLLYSAYLACGAADLAAAALHAAHAPEDDLLLVLAQMQSLSLDSETPHF